MVTEFISEKYMKNRELLFAINTLGFSLKAGQNHQVYLKNIQKNREICDKYMGFFSLKNRSQ
jgi:hypothetical protein